MATSTTLAAPGCPSCRSQAQGESSRSGAPRRCQAAKFCTTTSVERDGLAATAARHACAFCKTTAATFSSFHVRRPPNFSLDGPNCLREPVVWRMGSPGEPSGAAVAAPAAVAASPSASTPLPLEAAASKQAQADEEAVHEDEDTLAHRSQSAEQKEIAELTSMFSNRSSLTTTRASALTSARYNRWLLHEQNRNTGTHVRGESEQLRQKRLSFAEVRACVCAGCVPSLALASEIRRETCGWACDIVATSRTMHRGATQSVLM